MRLSLIIAASNRFVPAGGENQLQ